MHAKLLQSCQTLCDPMDCSLPGSSVRGILQAKILEWVAMPSSRGSSQPRFLALQEDSLPSEPPGKPFYCFAGLCFIYFFSNLCFFPPSANCGISFKVFFLVPWSIKLGYLRFFLFLQVVIYCHQISSLNCFVASLVVQWLRCHIPGRRAWVLSLVRELDPICLN